MDKLQPCFLIGGDHWIIKRGSIWLHRKGGGLERHVPLNLKCRAKCWFILEYLLVLLYYQTFCVNCKFEYNLGVIADRREHTVNIYFLYQKSWIPTLNICFSTTNCRPHKFKQLLRIENSGLNEILKINDVQI